MSSGGQDDLTEVIGEVTRALIPANTEDEVHRRVCEMFAASELFTFAWIGLSDSASDEVTPVATAGIAEDGFKQESQSGGSSLPELATEAVHSQKVTFGREIATGTHRDEADPQALDNEHQSWAFVPLVYEEAVHGVLHLASNSAGGIGTSERSSLAELGKTIAYTIETAAEPPETDLAKPDEIETALTGATAEPEQERRLYETIISSTPDLVYAFDLDYRFIFANDALLEMWGQTLEESIGKTLEEVGYEPWHAEMHEREIDQVVETKEPIRGEVGFEHAELGHRIYDYIFAPVLDNHGDVEAIAGTTRDITERKEVEEALQKSEERFRALINASSDVVYRMSPDWDEMQYLEGQDFLDDTTEPNSDWVDRYIHPDDRERVQAAIDEAIRTKSMFELEHRVEQTDGTVGWTSSRAVPMLDEDGDIIEWIGMASDVTEQKDREHELERALDLLEKTERIADVGGWEIDVETQEVFWSDHIFELLDVDADGEPPLEEALEMYHQDHRQRVQEAVERALDAGEPFDMEVRIETDSDDVRWLRLQGVPETIDGDIVTFRGAAQDVTERRRRERRLEELVGKLQESNERLEQFAYAASHDLQEPLRMVSTYLQLIEQRYSDELDEDGEEFIEFAVDGADRMRTMIDGLLQYSRVDSDGSSLQPVDLEAVFAEVNQDLQVKIEEHDAQISVEDLPRVRGDGDQLRQVFQNLLDNAITYSGDDPPRVHVSAERTSDGEDWLIAFRDEGIGIDPDDADRVFEVFQSLHSQDEYAGTGIGLAVCERIVERHGGDIWVESEAGEGTTFKFTLPPADAP